MRNNQFKLEVESKLASLPVIADFIANVMKQLGIDDSIVPGVQLAVDEACTNIINYAYSGQAGVITLVCELEDNDFVITIRDKGKPFSPLSVPPPDFTPDLDKRKIGGLGIYFMRKLMDEVTYNFSEENGNELRMGKKVH